MTRKGAIPVRVYLKHGSYYLVTLPDRKWIRLTRERDGLPALWRAYADQVERETRRDTMPEVIMRWLQGKSPSWSDGVRKDQERIATHMAQAFAEFRPDQVTTPIAYQYLQGLAGTPRTHNLHRTMLRSVLALAAIEGLREGHNPVSNIQPITMAKRIRIVTDAEVEAIKAASLSGRYGKGLVQMIELAMLTGQRIGDLIGMRWQDVTDEGIRFRQQKTGAMLLVEWTPALREAIEACATRERIGHVLKTETGRAYTYAGIRSAWVRACQRAGVEDLHIHDLRGRAGVDALGQDEDIRSAQKLLGHTSEKMTRGYIEGKYHKRVKPAR